MDDKTRIRLKKLDNLVKKKSLKEKSGHDYSHAKRVTSLAIKIARNKKNVDYETLIASCLIHDLKGIHEKKNLVKILKQTDFDKGKTEKIWGAVRQFRHIGKGSGKDFKKTIESEIFMDADNLEAMGSIGIVRAISFGNAHNFPIFKSEKDGIDDSMYGTIKSITSWNKSLFTKEAKKMAKDRIKIMNLFLRNIEREFR